MATVQSDPIATPLFMQAVSGDPAINYTAADFGQIPKTVFLSYGAVGATSFWVEQNDVLVGWSIKVRAGRALLGQYMIYSPTDQYISLATFNTSPSASRTHRVCLVVNDKNLGNGEYAARIIVIEDTGSGTTVPAGAAMTLAFITVGTSTSAITNSIINNSRTAASCFEPFESLSGYLASGITDASASAGTANARLRFGIDTVRFSGSIKKTSGTGVFPVGSTVIGTLPEQYRPVTDRWLIGATSGAMQWRLTVASNGVMTANVPDPGNTTYLYLDGITYDLH